MWETTVMLIHGLNMILTTIAFVLVVMCVKSAWRIRSAGNRFLWMGLGLFIATGFFSSAEHIVRGYNDGLAAVLLAFSCVYTIVALWNKIKGRWWEDLAERERTGQTSANPPDMTGEG